MSFALAFVLRYWRWFAGAGLAVLLIGAVWHHFHKDHATQSALVKARADLYEAQKASALWRLAYHDEKRAVDLQNDAVGKMAIQAADWQRAAQEATAEAHKANVKAQRSAAAFLAIKPKGATSCERVSNVASQIRSDAR